MPAYLAYLSLHHVHSAFSHFPDVVEHIHLSSFPPIVQQSIHRKKRPRTSHAGTEGTKWCHNGWCHNSWCHNSERPRMQYWLCDKFNWRFTTRELSGRLPTVNQYFTDHSTLLFPHMRLEGEKTHMFGGAVVWPLPEVKLNHRPLLFCLQGKISVLTTTVLFYLKVYIYYFRRILTSKGKNNF